MKRFFLACGVFVGLVSLTNYEKRGAYTWYGKRGFHSLH